MECTHFRNDPAFLEQAFGGLTSLGSAYASVRAEDGICLLHGRYLTARASCPEFERVGANHTTAAIGGCAPSKSDRGSPIRDALRRLNNSLLHAVLALGLLACFAANAAAQTTLLNVSYDPTRELYKDINPLFAANWKKNTGETVVIRMSHGGSGAQARAVIAGLDASVVTLALAADVDAIAAGTGKIPANWQGRLPDNSSPYTSTIVLLVRKNNPKHIKDWDDLARPGIEVVTPNPKTSGGARWNFLAAWSYAREKFNGDEGKIKDFMTALFRNVSVLDTGARGATTTFARRGIGDVLIAWENEAHLALEELGADKFEIVTPSLSILAEPTVTWVDGNVDHEGKSEVARAYLQFLYTPAAQALIAKHFYRPAKPQFATKADLAQFPPLKLVTIGKEFGGWAAAQRKYFAEGGIFDQIMANIHQ